MMQVAGQEAPSAAREAAHLERREEELPRRQLQEAHPRLCHGGFQEHHQVLGEAEAGKDGHRGCKARNEHPLTQLLQVIPEGHLQVIRQLLLVGV